MGENFKWVKRSKMGAEFTWAQNLKMGGKVRMRGKFKVATFKMGERFIMGQEMAQSSELGEELKI